MTVFIDEIGLVILFAIMFIVAFILMITLLSKLFHHIFARDKLEIKEATNGMFGAYANDKCIYIGTYEECQDKLSIN